MPFYDFRCKQCGESFHVMATMAEKDQKLIPCPACGGKELDRIYDKMNLSVGKSTPNQQNEGCGSCPRASGCPHAGK